MYMAEEEDHGRHEAGDYWYVPGMADFFTKQLGKIWGHVGEIFKMLEDCWANLANNGDTLGRCWELGQGLIG